MIPRPAIQVAKLGLPFALIAGLTVSHIFLMPEWLMDATMPLYVFPVALGAVWWGAWPAVALGLLVVGPLAPHMLAEHGALQATAELSALSVVVAFGFLVGWHIEQQARAGRTVSLLHRIAEGGTRGAPIAEIAEDVVAGMAQEAIIRSAWIWAHPLVGQPAFFAHRGLREGDRRRLGKVGKRPFVSGGDQHPFIPHMPTGMTAAIAAGAESWWEEPHPYVPSPPARLEVPLYVRGHRVGELGAEFQGWGWQRTEAVRFIQGIAREFSVALENRSLFELERNATREFQESELRYRELFTRSRDAILLVNQEGVIRAANEAAHRMVGCRDEELAGTNVSSFLPGVSLDDASLEAGGHLERRLLQQGRQERDIEVYGTPLAIEGPERLFQLILHDVTEQRLAASQMRGYVSGITRAQEEERKRIARELHDDTLQRLLVIARRLDALRSRAHLPTDTVAEFSDIEVAVQDTTAGLRLLGQNLRPSVLDDLGLPAAVEWLTEHLAANAGPAMRCTIRGEARRLLPEAEIGVFRIIQEALNNALRHADARRIDVTLTFEGDRLCATVSDDGKGFDALGLSGHLVSHGHLGLAGMKERADLLGARLEITSAPGCGATVMVELPVGHA